MSARFAITATPLEGLHVLQRHPIGDSRGYLERLFCDADLAGWLRGRAIRQITRTRTEAPGTVRGLHFQHPPHAEDKVVTCLTGEVFDVAVDLRRHSATFLRWHGEVLSGENHRSLLIPAGCAHGFQTLAPDCELLYFHTAPHVPEAEGGLHVADPRLAITWPLPVHGLSARDTRHPSLTEAFAGVEP